MRALPLAAAVLATTLSGVVLTSTAAVAKDAAVPGALSSTSVNTTRIDVPVPAGVTPRAIEGVLTMPEVVNNGVVTFRVNGRIAKSLPSRLYAKVRIPVTAADVVANGTIGLTIASQGPAIQGLCRPVAGEATFRKISLDYRGTETPPTTLATFFPPTSSGLDIVVAEDAGDDAIEAALAAVAAVTSRYPEGTPVRLTSPAELAAAADGVASQRVVVLEEGRPGDITTTIETAPGGVPTLTISATGEDLGNAARALALTQGGDTLQLTNDAEAEGLSGQLGQREPDLEITLADAGAADVTLSGYGTTSQLVTIPQDAFSSPVSSLDVHLVGAHSAVSDPDRARLDVRMNGELVSSRTLDSTGDLEVDFTVPGGRLDAVNRLELVLNAITPDGLPCAAPGSPPLEVDIDPAASTLTATAGRADSGGFQLFPQVLRSSLPVAIRTEGAERFAAVRDAARIIAALQHAATYPLDIQLVPADAFIADDRSGLLVGATTSDATSLEAPLELSSIRLLEQAGSSFAVTSQEPYAVLESIDVDDRQVLMLGGWAPGNEAAPRVLTSKVVGAVETGGWAPLKGDLLITDASSTPFVVDSRTLAAQEETEVAETEDRSYARWFVAGVALLLLLLAFQVVVSIRRDRKVAQIDDDSAGQPAYLEDLEFREQHLPPDEPAGAEQAAPARTAVTPPANLTKRSRNQKKKR